MDTLASPSQEHQNMEIEPPPPNPDKLTLYPTPGHGLEVPILKDINDLPAAADGKAIFRFDIESTNYCYDGVYHLPISRMQSRLYFFTSRYVCELAEQIFSDPGYPIDAKNRAERLKHHYRDLRPVGGNYTEDDLQPLLLMLSKLGIQPRPIRLEDIEHLAHICEILGHPYLFKERCLWDSVFYFHTGRTIAQIMNSDWHHSEVAEFRRMIEESLLKGGAYRDVFVYALAPGRKRKDWEPSPLYMMRASMTWN